LDNNSDRSMANSECIQSDDGRLIFVVGIVSKSDRHRIAIYQR
jgi:hypothetical protein